MPEEFFHVRFSSLEDMVRLVALSPTPFLQHAEVGGKHVYFFHSTSLLGRPVIYYTVTSEKLEKKYVVYNKFRDTISFSEKLEANGQSIYIPILEVESTNLLRFLLT
ncbi:MAG: hypothetical protein DRO52_04720 [Candidatus Hecatellales archaeon]|nr:MAG: hypothetical protein DRO52_04720 [Candidatus Hecatellales archaeon]